MKLPYPLMIGIALSAASLHGKFLLFDFESGYTLGSDVIGQNGWLGNEPDTADLFTVEAGVGVNGSNGLATSMASFADSIQYQPTPDELDAAERGFDGKMPYSFDISFDEVIPDGRFMYEIQLRDLTGSNGGRLLRMFLKLDGGVEYNTMDGSETIFPVFGSPERDSLGFVTISGAVDFAAQSTSVFIDGIQQKDYLFESVWGDGPDEIDQLSFGFNREDPVVGIAIDNVQLGVIPEPSVLGLFFVSIVLAPVLLRKRR